MCGGQMSNWFYSFLFDNCIREKNAQSFEDFFCEIMKSYDNNFQKVKASGRKGDCSCDGLNLSTDEYYLCYSPEDIKKISTQKNALKKISNDINGILSKWKSIHKIYYVINDKFMGLSPEILQLFDDLKKNIPTPDIEILSMEHLRKTCLSLDISDKQRILGFAPDLSTQKPLVNFETISKIIQYIEKNPRPLSSGEKYNVPDFNDKIAFNNLSNDISNQLNSAKYYISKVDDFFNAFPFYDKDDLKNHISQIYNESCTTIDSSEDNFADKRFYYVLNKIIYDYTSKAVSDNALIIMATFFESCDIFEEPVTKESVIYE